MHRGTAGNITTHSIDQRLARLESRNRAYLAFLVVVLAAGLLAMNSENATVRAHAFELVSEDGSTRATIRFEEGNPVFALNDENGIERLRLFSEPDATGLYVLDEEHTPRIGIAQFSHGGGGIALHGPQSKGAAVLYLKGEGSLRFFNADGAVTTQVPMPESDAAEQR